MQAAQPAQPEFLHTSRLTLGWLQTLVWLAAGSGIGGPSAALYYAAGVPALAMSALGIAAGAAILAGLVRWRIVLRKDAIEIPKWTQRFGLG